MRGTGFVFRAAFLALSATLLSGCLFQPGRFDAALQVMADGRFTYTYEGEIVMSGMQQLVEMAQQADESEAAELCYDEETFEERDCTAEEQAEQAQKEARDQAIMAAMFGGIDMSDPEAGRQLAATIQRQAGWDRVEFIEEGVFSVSFRISSRMGHDFDFPTLEGFPIANSFVQARLRDGNRLRIHAPGFAAERTGNPFSAMMMGMVGSMAQAEADADATPPQFLHPVAGTFRIVTDARILANNTDEGPADTPEGQVLEWKIAADTITAPTALLELTAP